MQSTLTIKEKMTTGILPVESIGWDHDHDGEGRCYAFYDNSEHELEFGDILLRFDLSITSYEGAEENDVFIGGIKEIWVGEERIEIPWEEEKELIKILVKHYENPFNIQ